ncbi:alpha/beta fold hydrolase [Thalassotalea castellviae]|uniref:Alpha/beta hydrolase n=1 Tax=Thalassotalea castellviae TaxID=3075612 RepID=A0ABU2ZXB3_9GAMM|nr:alpha/beta hydrolase [Thalassotalea sp. W431]MDT0602577.1 alpha/beta hydrolase [Thalassotalea sp. W431]
MANMIEQGVSVSGQGPVVVFLHSSLSSSKQWANLAAQLSEHFTCINIDLLGYGNASAACEKNYNFTIETTRINTIISQVAPSEKFHLVGHSCGGAIALKIAVEQPEKLLSLSLFEPVAFHLLALSHNENHNALARDVENFAEKLASVSQQQGAEAFIDFWNGEGFFAKLPHKIQTTMIEQFTKVKLDFIGILQERYSFEALQVIQCPCLLMVGKYSKAVSHVLSQAIAQSLKHVEYKEISSGHMAPISHPNLVQPLISSFIYHVK